MLLGKLTGRDIPPFDLQPLQQGRRQLKRTYDGFWKETQSAAYVPEPDAVSITNHDAVPGPLIDRYFCSSFYFAGWPVSPHGRTSKLY